MHPERWLEIEQLCHDALGREGDERGAFLDSACSGDAELRREVDSLLKHQKQAENFIETPALEQAAKQLAEVELAVTAPPRLIGRMISHYRIVERIGYGGMGEVYRAVRADDQYQKLVALKLVKADYDTQFVLTRFRNERQILAGLEHPNIARLIDGGTTEDGLPYFVMELVEGVPIDQYCDSHRLSVDDRLQLFRSVCSAVHYAHQHLVIHRDLKPGNIMVTGEGVPKLLDFGIAKIVDSDSLRAIEPTMTAMRVMTLEYASPEQIRGEAITTASDVYSLGVLLYYLLTGHLPYRLTTRTAHEVGHAICDVEPEKPSTAILRADDEPGTGGKLQRLAPEAVSRTREGQTDRLRRRLGGDLDQIVLKAIRKEKDRRYSSVEQFSEDIGRHLEGRPVLARKGTVSYRAGKFVRRHKAGVITAALVFLTLVGGMAAIVRESRLERAQRARAERRFNDVRTLANSLFDVHDAIANLPGTVAARKMIVEMSLRYLDSLATEAKGDPGLQRELADAYSRIADIQGRPGTENLGDIKGALANYEKSAAITKTVLATSHSDRDRDSLGVAYFRIGHALTDTGDIRGATTYDNLALEIFRDLTQRNPDNRHYQNLLNIVYLNLAQHQDFTGDYPASLASAGKAMDSYRQLEKASDPKSAHSAHYNLGLTYLMIATTWQNLGDYAKATEWSGKSLAIRNEVLDKNPKNVRAQLDLADTRYVIGHTLLRQGSPAKAQKELELSAAIAEAVMTSDPNDQRAKDDLADAYNGLAAALLDQRNPSKALAFSQKAATLAAAMAQADPANARSKDQLARADSLIGDAHQARGGNAESKEALAAYHQSLEIYIALHDAGSLPQIEAGEIARITGEIARCENKIGREAGKGSK